MLRRFLYSLAMFVAILVAYQAYVWAMVPWLEPPLAVRQSPRATSADVPRGGEPISRFQRLLAAYFPPDHWSQTQSPIVIQNETGSVLLALGKYKRHDDGLVEVDNFAVLIFPTPRQQSPTPPRDAIILEAPGGAQLQFDQKTFRPERGEIGAIQRGMFPGKITIRSDMRDPGPEDDLVIETTDLKMNSKLLYTEREVHFRLGPNVGSGRQLEIRLLEEETANGNSGLKIASVDSLEIFHDVRLEMHLKSGSLVPGDETARTAPAAKSASPFGDPSTPPVEVTCTGPFNFDFIKYVAGFDENVQVWQVNPSGPADQLSCDRLDICFARKLDADVPPATAGLEASSRQRADARWLEPDRILAEGFPVVVSSPSRSAEIRGRRVQLMLRQRKVAVDGGEDVSIKYGPNVLSAPQIQYQHPATDAGTKIGTFRASGPGTLSYLPDVNKPEQVFEAEWQASVEMGRHNGQPMLTVAGRPRLNMTGMGVLTADMVRVYLREVEADGKTQPIPDRMSAVGQVEINSPQLLAETRELAVNFQVAGESAPAPTAAGAAAPTGAARAPAADPAPFNLTRPTGPVDRQYKVQSDAMQLAVSLRGQRAVPTSLACTGHATFRELPHAQLNDQEPFEVHGELLTAERLDASALVTVRGAAPGSAGAPAVAPALAEIRARGMTLKTAAVQVDVGQNRIWSEGPGVANTLLKRSPAGSAAAGPAPVEFRWQGGFDFDGRTIAFRRQVAVDGPDDHVRCDELAARLTANVNFGQRVNENAIDIDEITCRGHVVMDHRSRDDVGLTSHERLELDQFSLNQQTGAINGVGPGTVRSTHLASKTPGLIPPGAQAANPLPNSAAKLHFLRVDFQQGLKGNFINRELTFLGRVRTIYGPVDAWGQEFDGSRPEQLPLDALTLTSDALRVNEDVMAAHSRAAGPSPVGGAPMGPVQLTATGNVRIDGQSPQQGMFAATADRVAYSEDKQQLIIEGSNRLPATLWHRDPASGQQIENSAGKIIYNRLTGQAQWDTVRSFQFTPGSGTPKSALGPAPVRQ